MHVLFTNVNRRNQDPQNRKTLQGLNFHELLYADDTLVVAKNTKTAKTYLKLIEEASEYYNLKQNKDKCRYVAFNKNKKITFGDGTPLKNVDETTYLGTEIAKRVDPGFEITRRISLTMPVLKELDLFWKQANVPKKWKLQVFQSVSVSKLLYSLEALQPTDATAAKLDRYFSTERPEKNIKHGNKIHKPGKHKQRSISKS